MESLVFTVSREGGCVVDWSQMWMEIESFTCSGLCGLWVEFITISQIYRYS